MSATGSDRSVAETDLLATLRRVAKPHFRAGVVIAIRRDDGRVLVFERVDHPGQWQLPQGGLERDETPERAAWRELAEETGLGPDDVTMVGEYEHWTSYVWPDGVAGRGGLGQTQRWFFFEPRSADITPTPDGREFGSWAWWTVEQLIDRVVEFRAPSYRLVLGG